MKKKILFICYFFPPFGGVRVLRNYSFIKYLSRISEYDLHIITSNFFSDGIEDKFLYYSLLNRKNISIHSLPSFNFETLVSKLKSLFYKKNKKTKNTEIKENLLLKKIINSFLIPDHYILFVILNFFKIYSIIKKIKPDIIFTSSPPHSMHLTGLLFKKKFKIKWVADFRDPWIGHKPFIEPVILLKNFNKYLEHSVIKNSDKIITCVEQIIENFKSNYPEIEEKKFSLILNGYDDEFFEKARNEIRLIEQNITKKNIIIAYTGSFNVWRSPEPIIKGLKYFEENIKFDYKLILDICGVCPETYKSLPLKYNLTKNSVNFYNHINYYESIKKMLTADINLLIVSDREGALVPTAKFSNYLAAKKPILALLPAGSIIKNFINDKIGIALENFSDKDIAFALLNIIENYEKFLYNFQNTDISVFSRYSQALKLKYIFDNI